MTPYGKGPRKRAFFVAVIPGRAKRELWCAIAHLRIWSSFHSIEILGYAIAYPSSMLRIAPE
ncbi:hypothetical protein V1292_000416 [Bradyrhizobium sp. AZCC 1719]